MNVLNIEKMTIKQAIELLKSGSKLSLVRKPKNRIDNLYLSIEIVHYIGDNKVSKALFDAIKKKVKLVTLIDESNSFKTVYKLSEL